MKLENQRCKQLGWLQKIPTRLKRANKNAAQINQQKAAQIMATMPASKVSKKSGQCH